MSSNTEKTPKTGLASRMREWMRTRHRNMPFTTALLSEGLKASQPAERMSIANSLQDFIRRGEVDVIPADRNQRQKYQYNRNWKPKKKGVQNRRIYKAMHVSATFSAADIERLSDAGRNHIDKTIRALVLEGHLQVAGRRLCGHGAGAEKVYRVVDRNRFRIEVLR